MITSLKVLIVDDNRSAANAIARMLRKSGDEVDAVYDGVSAIEHLQQSRYDLVLTDLKMEPVDGLAVLRAARALRPPTEVIVFTAYGAVAVAVEAMRMGARDFLTKPVSMNLILERLGQLRPENAPIPDLELVAHSPATQRLLRDLKRAAGVPSAVWIEGELGSGREWAAEILHKESKASGKLVVYDVGQDTPWPESGTVLIPNIDTLPHDLQRQLHRNIQRTPKGLRVISTSQPNGQRLVSEGRLSAELFYALAVVVVSVPPLRARVEDIVPLMQAGLTRYAKRYELPAPELTPEHELALKRHSWPGNIRELLNLAERASVMGEATLQFDVIDAPSSGLPALRDGFSLSAYMEGVEREVLVEALRQAKGDRTQAGKLLGVERNSLRYKLNKYGLLER